MSQKAIAMKTSSLYKREENHGFKGEKNHFSPKPTHSRAFLSLLCANLGTRALCCSPLL